jgi:type I restriction enzyme, S subunit
VKKRITKESDTAWPVIRLSELVTAPIVYGILQPGPDTDGGIPYIRPTEIVSGQIQVDSLRRTTHAISKRYSRSSLAPNDIMLSIVGTIGKVAIVPSQLKGGNITQSSARIRISTRCALPRYIAYALQSPQLTHQFDQMRLGTAVPRLNLAHVRDLMILVAPLPEQHRIVDAIETQFTRLDSAIASLERVKANLKRYRASVLKAAVEGKLVPTEAHLAKEEGRDYEPASVLLDRILIERRKRWEKAELEKMKTKGKVPKDDKWKKKYKEPVAPDTEGLPDLPEGWCWGRVDMIGKVQLGRQRSPKNHVGPDMRPYLRVANVFEDRIDTQDIMEMNFSPKEYDRFKLESGDILLNEGQSLELIGRPAIYRGEVPGACFTNTLVRFRTVLPFNSEFPFIVFRSYMRNGRFQKIAKITTNIAHLGAGRFSELEFPIPPSDEQFRIVEKLKRQLSIVDDLEKKTEKKRKQCSRLRQSILKWAFEGKLVDQDPNDEPASVLLERIKAEQATPKKKTKRKKKK